MKDRLEKLRAEDEAVIRASLKRLECDPTSLSDLNALGSIALAAGKRDAARTLFERVAQHHPSDCAAYVTLGNMAIEDGNAEHAHQHYQSALERDRNCVEASQGMARALTLLGRVADAEPFWHAGFAGHAIGPRRYHGASPGLDALYLASARGGNVRLWPWIDDRLVAVTIVYADYVDLSRPLPHHQLIVNAIGDADRAAPALAKAKSIVESSGVPVINLPSRVMMTRRDQLPTLCHGVEGLTVPRVARTSAKALLRAEPMNFPFLIRAPGFHTGEHFERVETRESLAAALSQMPGNDVLVIEELNARAGDGMVRKYRVMFVNGRLYPWHLAISRDWKVHYYTAAMGESAARRDEEQRFLADMPGVLGDKAMAALQALGNRLALDYAGLDFALGPDGSVLVFEANATMTINAPGPEAIWDYRRPAVATVQSAVIDMLSARR